jgi:hypothetical protein
MAVPVIQTIRPGVSFAPAAAASFVRVESDLGRRVDVNSTYRDYNTQLEMHRAWNRYVASGRKPALYPGHSMALHPDLSVHCLGNALDSDDWTRPGFNAFMAAHGWIRTAAGNPTEQHHFEYQSWRDQHLNRPASAGGKLISYNDTPATKEKEDDDMALQMYRRTKTGGVIMCNIATGFQWDIPAPNLLPMLIERQIVKPGWIELDENEWTFIHQLLLMARGASQGVVDTAGLAAAIVAKLPDGEPVGEAGLLAAIEAALKEVRDDVIAAIPTDFTITSSTAKA